jgi:hypothetical protein
MRFRDEGFAMNSMRWLFSDQGCILLSLLALLASAPLLGRPEDSIGVWTGVGWGLLILSLLLPLWSRVKVLLPTRRQAAR